MKINKYSLIILIVIILVATAVSNMLVVLYAPISVLRTLVLAITLSACFVLIYFSNWSRLKVCLACLVLMLITIVIEEFLPKVFTNEFTGSMDLTDYLASIYSLIRVTGYFLTLFVAMIAISFVRKVIKKEVEFTQKVIISLVLLIIGLIGSALSSAVNELELAMFTAMTGMLFSGMLYVAYSAMIIINPIPDKYLESESKDISE